MKEIEILVEVYESYDKIKNKLEQFGYKETKKIIDEYFYDPKRNDLKPDENGKIYNCLRVRQKENKYTITYKDDVYENGKWLYSNEYETEVKSIEVIKQIINKLGLKKFIEIENEKRYYYFKNYEIVLERVKDLGLFMEVEYCTNEDIDVKNVKKEIQDFIDGLDLKVSEELNMGKPEMYLIKHNIVIE